MTKDLTFYQCDFCDSEFATTVRFPDDIIPYCVNCGSDEHSVAKEHTFAYTNVKN